MAMYAMVKTQKIKVSILVILLVPHHDAICYAENGKSYCHSICYLDLYVTRYRTSNPPPYEVLIPPDRIIRQGKTSHSLRTAWCWFVTVMKYSEII